MVALCFPDILHDLGLEGFWCGKLAFFAEAVEEGELDGRISSESEGILGGVVVE